MERDEKIYPDRLNDQEETAQAPGYLIANYTIHDQEIYQKYVEAASALNARFGLRAIVYDANTRPMEGEPLSVIAIAEFQSFAAAERFYNSPEYQVAMKYRLASTEGSVLLARGSVLRS